MAGRTLAAVVGEALAAAHALEQVLQREREALRRQDADGLVSASTAKRAWVAGLEALEERRQSVCRDAGWPATPADMPAVLGSYHEPAASSAWAELCRVLAAAERLNAANGAIIRLKREQLAAALAILGGAPSGTAPTYGPAGGRSPARERRPLATI